MNKQVTCVSCGMVLDVPQRNGEPYRLFRCPNCSHQLRADFSVPQSDDSGGTVYGGAQGAAQQQKHSGDDSKTVLVSKSCAKRGVLRCAEQNYPLRNGSNLVGRKAPNSDADVQLAVTDKHISRQHAVIKVTRITDGSLKALISVCKDRLTTIVGGQALAVGDEVVLTNGTNLTLGETSLVYIEE